jgi:m7GpppX diphosphatase
MAKYGVPSLQLRVYVHYQPSYYHLHVHFTHLNYDAPGTVVGRAHLLDDIINNLELQDDFYKRKTLTYILRENDGLYSCFKQAGKL